MQEISQYSEAILEAGANTQQFAVLMYLATVSDRDGVGWHSHTTIAERFKKQRKWAWAVLDSIKKDPSLSKLIRIAQRHLPKGGQTSNKYKLIVPNTLSLKKDTPCPPQDTRSDSTLSTDSTLSGGEPVESNHREAPLNEVTLDWKPSDDDRAFALRRRGDVFADPELLEDMTRRFAEISRSQGRRYADISAAWRAWVIREWTHEQREHYHSGGRYNAKRSASGPRAKPASNPAGRAAPGASDDRQSPGGANVPSVRPERAGPPGKNNEDGDSIGRRAVAFFGG